MFNLLILQQDPNLTETVDKLSKTSIELAEAAANYGALKVIFGIMMVFVILMALFVAYTLFATSKKINAIYEDSDKIEKYFEGRSTGLVGNLQAQVLVRRSFNHLATIIKYYIIRIRIENHIDDKETTKKKVSRVVDNEFNEIRGFLSNFICDNIPVSEVWDYSDMESLKEVMLEQIYIPANEFHISSMDQSIEIFLKGIKLLYIKKI